MFDPNELVYGAFSAEAGYEEGKTPYDSIPLPPERKNPYSFKIARQDAVHPVLMFPYHTSDDSGQAKKSWKVIRLKGETDLADGLKEVFGEDVDVDEKMKSIKGDPDTVIYLGINLVFCVSEPGTPWDGRQIYLEFTNRKRPNSPTTPIAYLAARLGMAVTRETPGKDVATFLEGAIPLVDPPNFTADQSTVSIDCQVQWTGNYKDRSGKKVYIRGMNKWPLNKETGLHLEELDIKGANEPVRAQLEIVGF